MTLDSEDYLELSKSFPKSFFVFKDHSFLEASLLRTPGYPIFLWILNDNPIIITLVQSLLQISMAFVAILIYREVSPSSRTGHEKAIFLLVNFETSLTVYSLFLLSDLLFASLISLFMLFLIRCIKTKKVVDNTFLVAALFMLMAIIVRPIGVILFFYLIFLAVATREFKKIASLCAILVVWIGIWSGYNNFRADIFTYSTIQNNNLLLYEGAGAKAFSLGIDFKTSQQEELLLRKKVIGGGATLREIDSYSFERGLELIAGNFDGFVKMHFFGTLKVIYGPNQGEAINFLTNGTKIKAESNAQKILVATMFIFTFVLGTISILALIFFVFDRGIGSWIAQLSIIFILFSSGYQAYGRFRTPIALFMIVLSVNFVVRLLKRTTRIEEINADSGRRN